MEFMRCNKCYRGIKTMKICRLTQCYHLFCSECINEGMIAACPACKATKVQSKTLNNPLDVKIMINVFTDIDDLVEMNLEVERFQNEQTNLVMRALATMEKKYEMMRSEYWKSVKETNKMVEMYKRFKSKVKSSGVVGDGPSVEADARGRKIEHQEQQRKSYTFGYESSETFNEIPVKKMILDCRAYPMQTPTEFSPSRVQTPEYLNNISKDMNMRLRHSGYNSQTTNSKQYSKAMDSWDSEASPTTPRNRGVQYRYDPNPPLVPTRYVSGATVMSDVETPSPKTEDRDGLFLVPSIRKVPKSVTASLNSKFRSAARISSKNSLRGIADRFDDLSDEPMS